MRDLGQVLDRHVTVVQDGLSCQHTDDGIVGVLVCQLRELLELLRSKTLVAFELLFNFLPLKFDFSLQNLAF